MDLNENVLEENDEMIDEGGIEEMTDFEKNEFESDGETDLNETTASVNSDEPIDLTDNESDEIIDYDDVADESYDEDINDVDDVVINENPEEVSVTNETEENFEDLPEPAVPVDNQEEQSLERKNEGTTRRNTHIVPQRNRRNNNEEIQNKEIEFNFGTASEDVDLGENVSANADKVKMDINWRRLRSFANNNEILWGKLVAVSKERISFTADSEAKQYVVATVRWNDLLVKIPDILFFDESYRFGTRYSELDVLEKIDFRVNVLNKMVGATVCFVVQGIVPNSNQRIARDRNLLDYERNVVYGNRVDAMKLLRDIWFFHNNQKASTTNVNNTVNVGDLTPNAHVLSVRRDHVLIEVFGVETRLDAFNLDTASIDSCYDFKVNGHKIRPGDNLRVRVSKLHINRNPDSIHLRVSCRLRDVDHSVLNKTERGSVVLGVVSQYNITKDIYTVDLDTGITAAVHARNVEGHLKLTIGDRVSVYIFGKTATNAFGRAKKI